MSAGGAGELHRRVGGDAAVVGRVVDDGPASVALGNLDHADAVSGLPLAHVVRVLGGAGLAVAVDDATVHVLVVDREDVAAPVHEEGHSVVVVAEGSLLARAGAPRLGVEGGGVRPQRIPPPDDHVPAVARRHGDGVEGVRGDLRKGEPLRGARRAGGEAGRSRADDRRGAERGAAAEQGAARQHAFRDAVEIGAAGRGIAKFVELVEGDLVVMGARHALVSVWMRKMASGGACLRPPGPGTDYESAKCQGDDPNVALPRQAPLGNSPRFARIMLPIAIDAPTRCSHGARREALHRGYHRARRSDRHRDRAPRGSDERCRVVRRGDTDPSRHGAPGARGLPRGGCRRGDCQHLLHVPARAGRGGVGRRDGGHQPAGGRDRVRGARPGRPRAAGGGRRFHVQHLCVASGDGRTRPGVPSFAGAGSGQLPGDGGHPRGSGVRPAGDGNDARCRARAPGHGSGDGHRAAGVGGHQRQPEARRRHGGVGTWAWR